MSVLKFSEWVNDPPFEPQFHTLQFLHLDNLINNYFSKLVEYHAANEITLQFQWYHLLCQYKPFSYNLCFLSCFFWLTKMKWYCSIFSA